MMKRTKRGWYGVLLRFIHTFGIEEKTIRQLKQTEAEDVKAGRMYEHYGRIYVAEENVGNASGCEACDLNRLAQPCAPHCDYRCRFRLLEVRPQNATNQEQWQRTMLRKILGH